MKTIQTNVYIKQPGQLILDIPEDIPLGEHKIVVVIDEKTEPIKKKSLLGLWEEYGQAPGLNEIEEMRKDVWGNFPRERFRVRGSGNLFLQKKTIFLKKNLTNTYKNSIYYTYPEVQKWKQN